MSKALRVAAVQMSSSDDWAWNLEQVAGRVQLAQQAGAQLVALPENFAYFGSESGRCELAESLDGPPGPIRQQLSELARSYQIAILAGGWAERSPDPARPYNASTLFGSDGQMLANYRKIHLFDVTLPSGKRYAESANTRAGTELCVIPFGGLSLGMSICYDLRFPELYRALAAAGANVLTVPAAFTRETGREHWHILLRARAIESTCWVVAPAQVGQHPRGRETYGHALIVDPWGRICAEAESDSPLVCADLTQTELDAVRSRLPSLAQRRLGLAAP